MSAPRTIARILGPTLAVLFGLWPGAEALSQAPSRQAQPVDRDAWAKKLAALDEADWRVAFETGQELASLPGDEGFDILKANWEKINNVEARQQLLKSWYYATPYPLHVRNHPRLLDGLDLGARDRSHEVQTWALGFLGNLAFRDFSEDFQAYKAWYQANRDKPLADVIARSVQRFAIEADRLTTADARKRARWLVEHANVLWDRPEARQAVIDAGLLRTLERWAFQARNDSPPEDIELAGSALSVFGQLKPGEAELRRVVLPSLAREKPSKVRDAAIGALEGRENAWAVDLLLDALKANLDREPGESRTSIWTTAGTLESFGDPRVIPTMIAVIDVDNTYDTVYGVGYFGLGKLTGVQYDLSHDGPWWRQWWEKNKERYPASVRAIEIPKLPKRRHAADSAAADPLADVEDVPAQDLRAGGDDKKRYFLIGAKAGKVPDAGYGLLIVLPGGDGSADFLPFLRRVHKNVLNDRWLMAEAVAPKWDENQFHQIVWPTANSGYLAAKFTTEEFIRAIILDVKTRAKVDPRRVILLGWSSGGPPCYAEALLKDSAVTGAFIAMSIFRPGELPPLENAKGRAFYLLQSPQDQVTRFDHAEAAEKALQAAGLKVRLQRYDGGHGWLGDIWAMFRDGITWLDGQVGKK